MTTLLIVSLLVFLALNVPIGFALLLSSILYLAIGGEVPVIAAAQRVVAGTDHYLLLAIPFFFLAAELMNAAKIMDRLVRVALAIVGHIRGGLGHVSVISDMMLAGISGSAVADAAGLGRLQFEIMRNGGYSPGFAAALSGSSSTVGPIIPPSIPFVVYASIAGVSVGSLFLAGIVPGLFMGLFLMGVAYVTARRRNYPVRPRASLRTAATEIWRALPVIVLPVIILGGILSGAFTPTEAAVVAAAYAFVLGKFGLRTLHWKQIGPVLIKVGTDTARLMFIIAAGSLFGWILAREGIPQALADAFLSVSDRPWAILMMINVLLLILGCFLEPIVALILVVPILVPLVQSVGIDLIHFGVVVTLNLMIGLITPPVGTIMFIMMTVSRLPMEAFVRELWPMFVALIAVLLLITYIPWLVLAIPSLYAG
jgi:tripartite ATP-independent transporter DctM subunit